MTFYDKSMKIEVEYWFDQKVHYLVKKWYCISKFNIDNTHSHVIAADKNSVEF